MSVAVNNSGGGYTAGNSHTQSFTVGSGSDRVLIVGAMTQGGSVTGVTYNGVSMTLLTSQNTTGGMEFSSIYYLVNPPSGAHNIVVSATGASYTFAAAADYTGVDQTTPLPTSNTAFSDSTSGSPFSVSLTTTVDNSWLVGCFNVNLSTSAGTGTTLRATGDSQRKLYDSNGAKTPTGSYSLVVSIASGRKIAASIGELAPVSVGSSVKKYLGMFALIEKA